MTADIPTNTNGGVAVLNVDVNLINNFKVDVMSLPPKLIFRRKMRQKDGVVLQDLAKEIKLDVKTTNDNGFNSESGYKKKLVEHKYKHIDTDLWFSIAEFINPEDVLNFALICRQTAFVVTSAKFWSSLYRRFISKESNLPESLKVDCLYQIGSLRCKVISALYYVYPPFIERIKAGYELSSVERFKFISCWHRKERNVWIFCYKLWNHVITRTPRQQLDDSDSDEDGLSRILNKLNNVFENHHEGISLLVICSRRFIPFPNLHGADMILHSTRQLLASDLKSNNLELKFLPIRKLSPVSVDVVYPSIIKFKVIPWWHPDYKIFLFNEK